MNFKNLEKKENNTAVITVESDAEEFEAAVNSAYLKNKGKISIPGFRKGKAPRQVIEGMYGPDVFFEDAVDDLAPKAFETGIKEAEVKFVGAPSISSVEVTEEKTVKYDFSVELYPVVTLGQYKGLEAVRTSAEVTDEAVDAEIEAARKRNARMVSVEREAQMGDTAKIDFDGFLDGDRFDGGKAEGYSLELGSGSFVPGFEEQVVGMNIGEEKDINITFPEDYSEDLAGKAVVFKVKLNSLTVAELDELNDEFAQDVSEFDTFEEYKADVRATLEKRAKEQAENAVHTEIMQKAVDNMTVTVPECMIKEKIEEIVRNYAANFGMSDPNMSFEQIVELMGTDVNTISASIRPSAEFQVKQELLIEAVAEAENIVISDEDAEAYINKVAENVKAKPEEIKSYFGEEFIRTEQKKEIASNILFDSAVITDAE